MDVVVLILWIATALGGLYMLTVWLAGGGLRQQRIMRSRLPTPLLMVHGLLAGAGLVIWIARMLTTEKEELAWFAFMILLPVIGLGFAMFFQWIPSRRSREPGADAPAEQRFPVPVVFGHGALALTTEVLVLLTAIGAV